MKHQILFISILLFLVCSCIPPEVGTQPTARRAPNVKDNPMIHSEGVKIVDGQGNPIRLRGVILEGWLQWNGTLWGAGFTSETTITKRLEDLVGKQETEKFRQEIYDNFITSDDISQIAKLGFNVVRVPFNHRLLEDDDNPYKYKAEGWKHLDRVIDLCEQNGIYAVLDFHSVPGGQSGLFVADPDKVKVWDSAENMKRTVALWKSIAKRYRDRKAVAGYDLINEPSPPNGQALVNAYEQIISAIREVDPFHMIILEGGDIASNDFSMFEKTLDPNQVFSFHTYNLFGNSLDRAHLKKLTDLSNRLNAPLWNGEFGAHTKEWLTEAIEFFEKTDSNVNGWIYWPWKRIPEADSNRFRHLQGIKTTPSWDKVRHYCGSLFGWGKKPSKKVALQGMREFVEAVKMKNLTLDGQTLQALDSYKK